MSSQDTLPIARMARDQGWDQAANFPIDTDRHKCRQYGRQRRLHRRPKRCKAKESQGMGIPKDSSNLHRSCKTLRCNTKPISRKRPPECSNFLNTPHILCLTTSRSKLRSKLHTSLCNSFSHGSLQRSRYFPTSLVFHSTTPRVNPQLPRRWLNSMRQLLFSSKWPINSRHKQVDPHYPRPMQWESQITNTLLSLMYSNNSSSSNSKSSRTVLATMPLTINIWKHFGEPFKISGTEGSSKLVSVYSKSRSGFSAMQSSWVSDLAFRLVLRDTDPLIGLTKDEQPLHGERIKLWNDFNTCWLGVLQRQKDITQRMLDSGQPPPPPQSILQVEFLERMGRELVRLCDGMERHGLVDYQMGVWEEEIISGKFLSWLQSCTKLTGYQF